MELYIKYLGTPNISHRKTDELKKKFINNETIGDSMLPMKNIQGNFNFLSSYSHAGLQIRCLFDIPRIFR